MSQTSNLDLIKSYYKRFQKNPNDVDNDWRIFFEDLDDEASRYLNNKYVDYKEELKTNDNTTQALEASREDEYTANSLRARLLIRAYRIAGHLKADLDPLKLTKKQNIPDLDPKTYGLEEKDMNKEVFIDGVFGINRIKLNELIRILEKYYCGRIGTQFMHIQDKEQRDWIMDKIENVKPDEIFTEKGKKRFWKDLQQRSSLKIF